MNQQDDLEKFIRENREAFQEGAPADKVWDRLKDSLQETSGDKSRPKTLILRFSRSGKRWISAAAVLLLCISLAAFIRTYQITSQRMDTAIPADLQEAQGYYENRISQQIIKIKSLNLQAGSHDNSLVQLFGERDAEYGRLREALRENPGDAHVRAAFVEYYRSRLEVLNRVEKQLEENTGPHR